MDQRCAPCDKRFALQILVSACGHVCPDNEMALPMPENSAIPIPMDYRTMWLMGLYPISGANPDAFPHVAKKAMAL